VFVATGDKVFNSVSLVSGRLQTSKEASTKKPMVRKRNKCLGSGE
jgi:hypothetical protein